MITISKELLVEAGYKCWSENPVTEPHIVRKWQKVFTDDIGKKYFINVNESFGWHSYFEDLHNFWPTVQFDVCVNETSYQTISVSLVQWFNESGQYSKLTISEMENYCEHIWSTLGGQYYEKY